MVWVHANCKKKLQRNQKTLSNVLSNNQLSAIKLIVVIFYPTARVNGQCDFHSCQCSSHFCQLAHVKLQHGVLIQNPFCVVLETPSQISFVLNSLKVPIFQEKLKLVFWSHVNPRPCGRRRDKVASFSKSFLLYWISQNLYLYTYANWLKRLTFCLASAEDALDHRRLLARTLRAAVFILRQRVADLEK